MRDRTIIFTGAGFSAPANIPIQNRILEEMIKQENNILDVSQVNIELDNEKFLDAFVSVGLYLLTNYCDISDEVVNTEFFEITNSVLNDIYMEAKKSADRKDFLNSLLSKADLQQNVEEHGNTIGNTIIKDFLLNNGPTFDEYFAKMLYLKGEIKRRLEYCKIKVSLEDVFTAFDKAISLKTHTRNFTYHEEDDVRQAILRLFVYYFGKILNTHSYDTRDYLSFVEYVKGNADKSSIITTNWDTLTEGYFLKNGITYELCLNNIYYKFDDNRKNIARRKNSSPIKLIKLHGSINWFRCLQCGDMSIIEKNPCGEYLLSANKKEVCISCGGKSRGEAALLQPEIITPTMIKSFDNQLYKNLWASAAVELRNAAKVIFVGYSMPTADFELKYFLQNNIPPSCEIDVVLYHNDNPKQLSKKQGHLFELLPEKRYNDAFAKNSINFCYDGFGNYFSKCIAEHQVE
jgi:NAD-dependent SIR2 family protein deacetylase